MEQWKEIIGHTGRVSSSKPNFNYAAAVGVRTSLPI